MAKQPFEDVLTALRAAAEPTRLRGDPGRCRPVRGVAAAATNRTCATPAALSARPAAWSEEVLLRVPPNSPTATREVNSCFIVVSYCDDLFSAAELKIISPCPSNLPSNWFANFQNNEVSI